ncbi:hypothetical protein BJ508DRAFT_367480 [Ascobolus immersus RN42]|uniref:Uncharacterized protein n=1 Tax=Ascobolus immersus RN42 TaxID=1160509 RepID=A0A3N4HII0_ASCIM|nr:hypothetical protein BJ508DRAFT_367480 [Ascobolus immersus RN42]
MGILTLVLVWTHLLFCSISLSLPSASNTTDLDQVLNGGSPAEDCRVFHPAQLSSNASDAQGNSSTTQPQTFCFGSSVRPQYFLSRLHGYEWLLADKRYHKAQMYFDMYVESSLGSPRRDDVDEAIKMLEAFPKKDNHLYAYSQDALYRGECDTIAIYNSAGLGFCAPWKKQDRHPNYPRSAAAPDLDVLFMANRFRTFLEYLKGDKIVKGRVGGLMRMLISAQTFPTFAKYQSTCRARCSSSLSFGMVSFLTRVLWIYCYLCFLPFSFSASSNLTDPAPPSEHTSPDDDCRVFEPLFLSNDTLHASFDTPTLPQTICKTSLLRTQYFLTRLHGYDGLLADKRYKNAQTYFDLYISSSSSSPHRSDVNKAIKYLESSKNRVIPQAALYRGKCYFITAYNTAGLGVCAPWGRQRHANYPLQQYAPQLDVRFFADRFRTFLEYLQGDKVVKGRVEGWMRLRMPRWKGYIKLEGGGAMWLYDLVIFYPSR